jgi:hypothetical protein
MKLKKLQKKLIKRQLKDIENRKVEYQQFLQLAEMAFMSFMPQPENSAKTSEKEAIDEGV